MNDDVLLKKPTCFLICGKPGCGKSTLAEKLCKEWNCIHINAVEALKSEISKGIQDELLIKLFQGTDVSEENILPLVKNIVDSPLVQHYGYVLDGLPLVSYHHLSFCEQFDVMNSWKLKPDCIIYLKVPDVDLIRRHSKQYLNTLDGSSVIIRDEYMPMKLPLDGQTTRKSVENRDDRNHDNEENDNGSEELDSSEVKTLCVNPFPDLVHQPEDFEENVRAELHEFNDKVLYEIENMITKHDKQYVLEIDGNMDPEEMFALLMSWLDTLSPTRPPVPRKLWNQAAQGPFPEEADAEETLILLKENGAVDQAHEWHCSSWGLYCPVALCQGKIKQGKGDYGVGFLDKIFLLSSEEALNLFLINPRPFLLPPNPQFPCKLFVIGPPCSGRSTLSHSLAKKFGAEVINVETMVTDIVAEKNRKKDFTSESNEDVVNRDEKDVLETDADTEDVRQDPDFQVEDIDFSDVLSALQYEITVAERNGLFNNGFFERVGGWVVDNLPEDIEFWNLLNELDVLPFKVICLEDTSENYTAFLSFWSKENDKSSEDERKLQTRIKQFESAYQNISEVLEHVGLEPLQIDVFGKDPVTVLETVMLKLQETFEYKAKVVGAEDENLEDSSCDDDGGISLTDAQMASLGPTKLFCPVTLREKFVLCQGESEFRATYQGFLYFFNSKEQRDKFLENPEEYSWLNESPKIPPLRVCVIGTEGSGKQDHCKRISENFGALYVNFIEFWQETVKKVTGKRTVHWTSLSVKGSKETFIEDDTFILKEKQVSDELEADTEETEENTFEDNLNGSIEDVEHFFQEADANLPHSSLQIVRKWWMDEPFKTQGFVLQSFPNDISDVKYMLQEAWCPDVILYLKTDVKVTVKQRLPNLLEEWKKRRQQDQERKFLKNKKIPLIEIQSGLNLKKTTRGVNKTINEIIRKRSNIFANVYRISLESAKSLLQVGYKTLSYFHRWCPVQVFVGDPIIPFQNIIHLKPEQTSETYPVVLGKHIFFLSNLEAVSEFMADPQNYLLESVGPPVRICAAVVGPPKSGKTTLAQKFEKMYKTSSLSLGNCVEYILNHHPNTYLALQLKQHLCKGLTVSDELAVMALEETLMGKHSTVRGYVLDGFPMTQKQAQLMSGRHIIPFLVIELQLSRNIALYRMDRETNKLSNLKLPVLLEPYILSVYYDQWEKEREKMYQWFNVQYHNWVTLNASFSMWRVWHDARYFMFNIVKHIQEYLVRIREGLAASIFHLCVTPTQLNERLGESRHYCLVSLCKGELLDCSGDEEQKYVAEYKEKYYRFSSEETLKEFLDNPEIFVSKLHAKTVSLPDELPQCCSPNEVEKLCTEIAFRGACPVTYVTGNNRYQKEYIPLLLRSVCLVSPAFCTIIRLTLNELKGMSARILSLHFYFSTQKIIIYIYVYHLNFFLWYRDEALVKGSIKFAAKYIGKIYLMESESKLQEFLKFPSLYGKAMLPSEFSFPQEPLDPNSLSNADYLKQIFSDILIKTMTSLTSSKPVFPHLGAKASALVYLAWSLKTSNLKLSEFSRQKYRNKLQEFCDASKLIPTISDKMSIETPMPWEIPADFEYKLETFLKLRNSNYRNKFFEL
ncbi:adenylate kinase 9-like [Limulus polyphemus]|uniref:Adenylate kinase 9-like n=1 Tax=Limulus polyphemus TaxID=6850 RepID=A0ABM1S3G1_LIMPO|nr:adenylate kinase 9-like [Limulus polyphemus]